MSGQTLTWRAADCHQEAVTLQAARADGGVAVYGQNRQLEKEYLRLTSMPTLDAVRPPAVLKKALKLVQQRWLQVRALSPVLHPESPAESVNYGWVFASVLCPFTWPRQGSGVACRMRTTHMLVSSSSRSGRT